METRRPLRFGARRAAPPQLQADVGADRDHGAFVRSNALAATLAAALVAWLAVSGVQVGSDPQSLHGGVFQWLGALVLTPAEPLFGLAALAHARGWRSRWWVQAASVVYVAVAFGPVAVGLAFG